MTGEALLARATALVPEATRAPAEQVRALPVVLVPRAAAARALATFRDDPELALDRLCDLTCVDYLGRTPRFEVVYQLHSLTRNHRLRVKVPLPADDPSVPTASALWKSALWAEREAWDMFGVRFTGHPDLRRLLMYPEFEGHPLRKDYPLMQRQPLVPERDPIADPWYPRAAGR